MNFSARCLRALSNVPTVGVTVPKLLQSVL
jgi:hypothetical protein